MIICPTCIRKKIAKILIKYMKVVAFKKYQVFDKSRKWSAEKMF